MLPFLRRHNPDQVFGSALLRTLSRLCGSPGYYLHDRSAAGGKDVYGQPVAARQLHFILLLGSIFTGYGRRQCPAGDNSAPLESCPGGHHCASCLTEGWADPGLTPFFRSVSYVSP